MLYVAIHKYVHKLACVFILFICLSSDHFTFTDESSTRPPNVTEITSFPATESSLQNPYNFTLGCMVQYGKPVKYGVIRWIGKLPKDQKTIYAGLVLVRLNNLHQTYIV